jgi:hypothetical protein
VPFWNEGITAVYVHSAYENPYEHSRGDIVENIDFEQLKKVTTGIAGLAIELSVQDAVWGEEVPK